MMLLRGMSWSGAILCFFFPLPFFVFFFFSFEGHAILFFKSRYIYPATPYVVYADSHFGEREKGSVFSLFASSSFLPFSVLGIFSVDEMWWAGWPLSESFVSFFLVRVPFSLFFFFFFPPPPLQFLKWAMGFFSEK